MNAAEKKMIQLNVTMNRYDREMERSANPYSKHSTTINYISRLMDMSDNIAVLIDNLDDENLADVRTRNNLIRVRYKVLEYYNRLTDLANELEGPATTFHENNYDALQLENINNPWRWGEANPVVSWSRSRSISRSRNPTQRRRKKKRKTRKSRRR